MTADGGVQPELVAAVRSVCRALPEVHEELAWVGVRWRVRTRTFAHVLRIEDGAPASYARAAGSDGPLDVVTFRSAGPELEALTATGPPFFRAEWGRTVMGLVLGPDVDWDEVAELLTESYCLLAPQKLIGRVGRPSV